MLDRILRAPPFFEWYDPPAGPVCLPRLRHGGGATAFGERLLAGAGVMLVPSPLFPGMPDDRVRFGLGRDDVEDVLARLEKFIYDDR